MARQNTRPDRKAKRQEEAKQRQARWDALTGIERAAEKKAQGHSYYPPCIK